MKSARDIRQTLYAISLLVTASASATVYYQQPVLSQENDLKVKNLNDLVCYMQTNDGQIISLNKICGSTEDNLALTTTDQEFLDSYQRSLKKRLSASSLPLVLSQAQQPQAVIRKAQSICTALKSGMPTESLKPQGKAEIDIVNALAPKYYCPEFHD